MQRSQRKNTFAEVANTSGNKDERTIVETAEHSTWMRTYKLVMGLVKGYCL